MCYPQQSMTIEDVVKLSSEVLITDGSHAPTLILAGIRQKYALQLRITVESYEQKAAQMFALDSTIGRSEWLGELTQRFFVGEAWSAIAPFGQVPMRRPSENPSHREVLCIARFTIEAGADHIQLLEVQRADDDSIIALRPFQGKRSRG